ncbi:MAG: hypothetical protein COA67_06575 [Lutibacter sp.]|nr:MAG: hypothetical protein COA67_06575 [Lutibacter sp.]
MKNLKSILQLSILATLFLTSCSKDDDSPIITVTDYATSIEENVPTATSLGTVNAASNNNATLSYSIASQVPTGAVTINSTTGELTVSDATIFDFETNPEITGVINITTNGASESINFTITLLDVVAKKVLVLGADDSSWLEDVGQKIEDTNFFDTVDIHNSKDSLVSSAKLMNYDAVLVYTNNGPISASEFGDNLAVFIDNGGGVVESTFGGNVTITGGYNSYKVYDTSNSIGQSSGTVRTLGAVLDSNHPIMDGVSTFDGGSSSYYNTGIVAVTGAAKIAEYDNGEPLIVVKNQVGQKGVPGVFVNFFPPSKDVRNDFWDATTNGDLILGNSLKWVGNK